MMHIIYNQDGSIKKKKITEYIQQGSSYYNVLFVAIEGLTGWSLGATVTIPNGRNIALVGSSATRTIDGVSYSGKMISLDETCTSIAGAIRINVAATQDNVTLVTYSIYLNVNETAYDVTAPMMMTYQNYVSLLTEIDSKISKSQADGYYVAASEKGQPNGVATLGSNGKLPLDQLPATSINDVVMGYFDGDNTFYEDEDETIDIEPAENKIYIDRWSGYTYAWDDENREYRPTFNPEDRDTKYYFHYVQIFTDTHEALNLKILSKSAIPIDDDTIRNYIDDSTSVGNQVIGQVRWDPRESATWEDGYPCWDFKWLHLQGLVSFRAMAVTGDESDRGTISVDSRANVGISIVYDTVKEVH